MHQIVSPGIYMKKHALKKKKSRQVSIFFFCREKTEAKTSIERNECRVKSLQESHKTPRRFSSRICGLGEVIPVAVNHDIFVEVTEVHGKRVEEVILALRLRLSCAKDHFRARKELALRGDESRAEFLWLCQ